MPPPTPAATRVDKPPAPTLIPRVPSVRRLVAVLLLSLWLPATLHCDLEAAGLDTLFHCADETAAAPSDGCCKGNTAARDACDLVEGSAFKPAPNTATLPPPVSRGDLLALLLAPPPPRVVAPPPAALTDRTVAPPEVARRWHFVARAAPRPRAPSRA